MAYKYKWDQKTSMEGKAVIWFYKYETRQELLEEHFQTSFDELDGAEVCGGDGRGGEYKLSFEEMVENINQMACYGFACKREGKNQIHFWFHTFVLCIYHCARTNQKFLF